MVNIGRVRLSLSRAAIAAGLTLIVVLISLMGSVALAVEDPPFKPVLNDGAFEVRDYPPLIVAEVIVDGTQSEAANAGFRKLAHYIFSGNDRKERIAMTAPVLQARQAAAQGQWVVRFLMPPGRTMTSLPLPSDPSVKLTAIPAQRMAVLRYSGRTDSAAMERRSAEILAWTRRHDLTTEDPIWLAQYDPPWTLGFMRRNEVMIWITAP